MPTPLDALIARLENYRRAAQYERAAHELRGDDDAAEVSADLAFSIGEQINGLVARAFDAEALAAA
jgi:hypothetical protein